MRSSVDGASVDSLLAFAVAAFVLIIVPGPSVLFVVSRGVALGRRAALLSVLGNEAGLGVHVIAVSLGLGAVVERSATVFTVLKLAGAAYLVYLGRQGDPHAGARCAACSTRPLCPSAADACSARASSSASATRR